MSRYEDLDGTIRIGDGTLEKAEKVDARGKNPPELRATHHETKGIEPRVLEPIQSVVEPFPELAVSQQRISPMNRHEPVVNGRRNVIPQPFVGRFGLAVFDYAKRSTVKPPTDVT